jgi:hypothetical protein
LAVFCTKITKLVQQAAPRARIHEGMCTDFTAMQAVFMLQGTIMAFNFPLFIQKQTKAKHFNKYTNFELASFCT